MRSDSASATTPRTTGTRSTRLRFAHETTGSEVTSVSPSGLRTATAQVETPRIITPSRTACPPTGASFTASRSGLGDAEALICLRRLARRGAGEEARVVALVELADGVVGIDAHAQRARAGGT